MLDIDKYLDALLFIATNRITHYKNQFPFNCGYIDFDASLSFDCIGLVKSVINESDIAYKKAPVSYYVRPGQVVPDWYGEIELFNAAKLQGYSDFHKAVPGSFLYLNDSILGSHGGVFIGDYGTVNVIECTMGWGADRVVLSWVDNDGTRRDQKDGVILGKWTGWSATSDFINYEKWHKCGKNQFWYYGIFPGWINDHNYNGWFRTVEGGRMVTGWFYDDHYKGWFYLNPKNNGKFYTGQMITGWFYDDHYKGWFYLNPKNNGKFYTGQMITGWFYDDHYKGWFYFCPKNNGKFYTGQMVTGDYVIDGKKYHFANNGKLVD